MGKLENRSSRMNFHRLIMRIETVRNDPRYAFMFENANVGGDTMAETLGQLFRLPSNGRPMTIMQLAGFPSDVVDAVVSVLCRMAFDFGLWSDGAVPLLFVCEEAHRYAAADRTLGFGPTRKAIARIAKEGRKYGVFLGLVTQRPAELDPTIISQCSTLFAMRMANDRDQALLRSAVSDAAANLLAFVPSLGTREVLAFGEGVALPTRLKFKELAKDLLPKSETVTNARLDPERDTSDGFLESVIDRWRGATMSHKQKFDDGTQDLEFDCAAGIRAAAAGARSRPLQAVEEAHRRRRRGPAKPQPLAAEVAAGYAISTTILPKWLPSRIAAKASCTREKGNTSEITGSRPLAAIAPSMSRKSSAEPQVTPCSATWRITTSGSVISALVPASTPTIATMPPGRTERIAVSRSPTTSTTRSNAPPTRRRAVSAQVSSRA